MSRLRDDAEVIEIADSYVPAKCNDFSRASQKERRALIARFRGLSQERKNAALREVVKKNFRDDDDAARIEAFKTTTALLLVGANPEVALGVREATALNTAVRKSTYGEERRIGYFTAFLRPGGETLFGDPTVRRAFYRIPLDGECCLDYVVALPDEYAPHRFRVLKNSGSRVGDLFASSASAFPNLYASNTDEMVAFCLRNLKDVFGDEFDADAVVRIHTTTHEGRRTYHPTTLLVLAVSKNYPSTVRYLVTPVEEGGAGANPSKPARPGRSTPLHVAIGKSLPEIVAILVAAGADLSVEAVVENYPLGVNCLRYAVESAVGAEQDSDGERIRNIVVDEFNRRDDETLDKFAAISLIRPSVDKYVLRKMVFDAQDPPRPSIPWRFYGPPPPADRWRSQNTLRR